MTTLPAWHVKNQGYINAAGQWGRPQKNNWAFIWPKDKPNQTKWGRMGDILTGKGPDIFVASNPNRRVSASDGPTRRRWTGFPNEEKNPFSRAADANGWYGDLPGASRMNRPHYDFRKRRYRSVPHTGQWTDQWPQPNGRGKPNAIERWPDMNVAQPLARPDGYLPYYDPRNWGQMNKFDGYWGDGGYWNPLHDGWPL